jgi:hypothetical protein
MHLKRSVIRFPTNPPPKKSQRSPAGLRSYIKKLVEYHRLRRALKLLGHDPE